MEIDCVLFKAISAAEVIVSRCLRAIKLMSRRKKNLHLCISQEYPGGSENPIWRVSSLCCSTPEATETMMPSIFFFLNLASILYMVRSLIPFYARLSCVSALAIIKLMHSVCKCMEMQQIYVTLLLSVGFSFTPHEQETYLTAWGENSWGKKKDSNTIKCGFSGLQIFCKL